MSVRYPAVFGSARATPTCGHVAQLGQSVRLLTEMSGVRIPSCPCSEERSDERTGSTGILNYARRASRVSQQFESPRARILSRANASDESGEGFEPWKSQRPSEARSTVFLRFESPRARVPFYFVGCARCARAPLSAHGRKAPVRTASGTSGPARLAKNYVKNLLRSLRSRSETRGFAARMLKQQSSTAFRNAYRSELSSRPSRGRPTSAAGLPRSPSGRRGSGSSSRSRSSVRPSGSRVRASRCRGHSPDNRAWARDTVTHAVNLKYGTLCVNNSIQFRPATRRYPRVRRTRREGSASYALWQAGRSRGLPRR